MAIEDFAFAAAELTVAPGATITYRNTGQAPHTATFDDVALDTGTLDSGASGALVAPQQPGSYSHFFAIHPRIRATLVVLASDGVGPDGDPLVAEVSVASSVLSFDLSAQAVDEPLCSFGGCVALEAARPA